MDTGALPETAVPLRTGSEPSELADSLETSKIEGNSLRSRMTPVVLSSDNNLESLNPPTSLHVAATLLTAHGRGRHPHFGEPTMCWLQERRGGSGEGRLRPSV